MGCCPCWRSSGSSERIRISQNNFDASNVDGQKRIPNYQAVVDEAHRKFLNSSFVRRGTPDSETESMRTKLMNSSISSSIFTSPKRTKLSTNHDVSGPQGVIDILSVPVQVFNHDVLADEMAELVARHTFNLRSDDSNSAVASFKPIFP